MPHLQPHGRHYPPLLLLHLQSNPSRFLLLKPLPRLHQCPHSLPDPRLTTIVLIARRYILRWGRLGTCSRLDWNQ